MKTTTIDNIVYQHCSKSQKLEEDIAAMAAKLLTFGTVATSLLDTNRNIMISNMAQFMRRIFREGHRVEHQVQEEIMHFFKDGYWIVGVACQVGDLTFTLPAPNRHSNILSNASFQQMCAPIKERDPSAYATREQGFEIYHCGANMFRGRIGALAIASDNGQLRRRAGKDNYQGEELFSEDLW